MNKERWKPKGKGLLITVIALFLLLLTGFLFYQGYKLPKINKPETVHPSDPDAKEGSYRALYHFTVPDKWKNDPQRPVYYHGKYHYYYLYNGDYPDGNGTEWRRATSEDLVNWKDEGIAIPKYTNKNGDPWSGSVVIDWENTAGFGEGAMIAIVTQPSANGKQQEQFLWYSKDHGKTFTSYSDTPVMPNPGTKDFRDPKILWDSIHDKWVMVMAEGAKIGFYESPDLKNWHYISGFYTDNIGILECPDLYMMEGSDGALKWILGASANGKAIGKPNTYAYWTGDFDGKQFIPDHPDPGWLDYGFDWYGGVTFEDGEAADPHKVRYALAWMNNWDYADNTPTMKEGFNGTDSIVRQIELMHEGGNRYYLASKPIDGLQNLVKSTDYIDQVNVNGFKTLPITGEAFQLDADISWSDLSNTGIRLRESADKESYIDVGVFLEENYSYVNRAFTGLPLEGLNVESKAPFNHRKKNVHLKILVDVSTIEVFVDDGKTVHSNLVFPDHDDKGITLYSEGGTAVFRNIAIKHFGHIDTERKD